MFLECQNINTFWQKSMSQIGPKKILWLKKLKTLCPGYMLLVILTEKKLLQRFMEKKFQKANQKEFRIEKVINEKTINCMLNGKATIILLTVG